jgi:sulfite reductase (NADPH) hemoprotein beta-component
MTNTLIDRSSDISQPVSRLHSNEQLKAKSDHLRGNIAQGLMDSLTGAVPGDDPLLMKFHGVYQQDDRDRRQDRLQRKLEPAFQFMVRLRIPAGMLTREQWIGLNRIAARFGDRGIRITTRQTIQLHGVRKRHLRSCLQAIRDLGLDTIAACGDDSRGVVCGANPSLSEVHQQVVALAQATSQRLIPRTGAYPEIWYGEATGVPREKEEPVYGELYLPRKFKVGFVIPPVNDIDVYGQDLGFIAVVEKRMLVGFNVCVGGGMGQLDSREDSYPRLAELVGFIEADKAPELAEIIMGIQRDFGDRQDRHRARFKYTLDRLGTDWFLQTLAERLGHPLSKPRPVAPFTHNTELPGWQLGDNGLWHGTLYIESGRVQGALQDQLLGFMQQYSGNIRLTPNQNLQLIDIEPYHLEQVRWRLEDLGLASRLVPYIQNAHTISCVALPTCGLAMAEAERYAPQFLHHFHRLKSIHGLAAQPITLRITGCPNGCARPYLAEIALTGRAMGLYNLYLGGSFHGDRLNQLYAQNVNEESILQILDPLFQRYAQERLEDEHFGDFLHRSGALKDNASSNQSLNHYC